MAKSQKNIAPESTPGPLAPLMSGFCSAPGWMVGANAARLGAFYAEKRIRIVLRHSLDTTAFWINQHREIHTYLRGLEHLWGTLYAYTVIYDSAKANEGKVNLGDRNEGKNATKFLDWAFGDPAAMWPVDLPIPSNTDDPLVLNTNNLFKLVAGFVLLHEIGHAVLGHTNNPVRNREKKILREYDADDWAIREIVSGNNLERTSEYFLAVAMTLGVIGGLELAGEDGSVREHPKPPKRIAHFIRTHVIPSGVNEETKAGVRLAAAAPIQAHLLRRGEVEFPAYETFEDFFTNADRHYR